MMKYNFNNFPDIDRSNFVRHNPAFLKIVFGSEDLLPFWVADTDFAVFPELSAALADRARNAHFPYETKSPELKQSLASWYANRYQINIHPKRLLFLPSVNTGIAAVIDEFTNKGDGVIIQPPVFQAFAGIIESLDREVINNQLVLRNNHYEINFDDLEAKASQANTKAFLLCSPHNPVGRVWQEHELKRIAEICEAHELLMITDEIHGDIVYSPHRYIGMLSIYEPLGKNIIMVSSAGKSFGIPGLIDSFVYSPNTSYYKQLKHRIEKYHLDKSNGFANTAWETIYDKGDNFLGEMLLYLKGNINYIVKFLSKELPKVTISPPEGTYQVWLNFNELGMNNEELNEFLVTKARLAFNQGHTYGIGGDGYMRMNIASPRSLIEQAMNQLKQAVLELETEA